MVFLVVDSSTGDLAHSRSPTRWYFRPFKPLSSLLKHALGPLRHRRPASPILVCYAPLLPAGSPQPARAGVGQRQEMPIPCAGPPAGFGLFLNLPPWSNGLPVATNTTKPLSGELQIQYAGLPVYICI
jgi:hypothetical protein